MLRSKIGKISALMIDTGESSTRGTPRIPLTAIPASKNTILMPIKIALVHDSEYS